MRLDKQENIAHGDPSDPDVPTCELISHLGMKCARIQGRNATHIHDLVGGGFASLLDSDGFDWISYKPEGGSAGHFRGIPNAVFRGGGAGPNFFHPGHAGEKASRTVVERRSPGLVVLRSISLDNKWECEWELRSEGARFTMLRVDPLSPAWWFLYEGTPGGRFDEDDFSLRSGGKPIPLSEKWGARTVETPWVAFASRARKRSLLFVMRGIPDAPVSYYGMEGNMTVFGIGRELGPARGHLTAAPVSVAMRFVESANPEEIAGAAEEFLSQPWGA